jgi:tape measure domain-containing protein
MSAFVIPTIFSAIDKFTAPVLKMQRAVNSFSAKFEILNARASRAMNSVGLGANKAYRALNPLNKLNSALTFTGITVGAAGVVSILSKIVKEATKVEDATASFQSLLGSVDKAANLVGRLNTLGAETPFKFSDLTDAAQLMISFGAATEANVIDKLKIMGDLAQGNAEKLGGIALAYSQIEGAGKASMQDVNQLINNGVPILKSLADMWGVNVGKAREMVSQGKATSKEISRAFDRMTESGGMFYNGMQIASQTVTGKFSTLQDNIDKVFETIGTAAMPVIKEFIDKAMQAVEKVQAWADANRELIAVTVREWAARASEAIAFLWKNFDTIVKVVKYYIGLLLFLRTVTLLSALATKAMAVMTWLVNAAVFAYNSVLGISIFLTGKSTLAIARNGQALGAYNVVSKAAAFFTGIWTKAQKVFNVVMGNNPLGWVIRIIAVLIGIIALAAQGTEGWGEQWDATVKWMKSVLDFFVTGVQLQWQVLSHGFWSMIDAVVLAWKWGMNKLGILSDEQYAKDVANIQAEKKLRLNTMAETQSKLAKSWKAVTEGPGWHVREKVAEAAPATSDAFQLPGMSLDDPMSDFVAFSKNMGNDFDMNGFGFDGAVPSLPSSFRMNDYAVPKRSATPEKAPVELTVKVDGAADARVSRNPKGIPVKVRPTIGGHFNNWKY